jgi:hypothetical protein
MVMTDWWREALLLARLRRRQLMLLGAPLMLGAGCWEETGRYDDDTLEAARLDELEQSVDALALQRREGWNVGQPERALAFAGSSVTDASGTQGWRAALQDLAPRLQPGPRLLPYYVPTLFQSLVGPSSQLLRAVMRPVHTAEMDADFGRGLALRAAFEQAGWPSDTALVVDAPGPRAVALAAALADRFEPVFTFANWPHPLGVVPAHETLAAALFYLPIFEWARNVRPPSRNAPPVFVLDANRLAPYTDADDQFDNRYFARLPSAAQLGALGIRHVLYVSADGTRELDDLNQSFVELGAHGVDVKLVALGDFAPGAYADGELAPDESLDAPDWLVDLWLGVGFYWYGGSPSVQTCFWDDYRWYRPPRRVVVGPPRGGRRRWVVGPPPLRVMPGAPRWVPAPRSTPLDGWHATVAGGVGRVPVRASRQDGTITGVRPGRSGSYASSGGHQISYGRSGSLGRVGGGFSG